MVMQNVQDAGRTAFYGCRNTSRLAVGLVTSIGMVLKAATASRPQQGLEVYGPS